MANQGLRATRSRLSLRTITITYVVVVVAVLAGLIVAYRHFFLSPASPPLASVHTSNAVMIMPNTPAQTVVANCPSGSTALSGGYSIMDAAHPNQDYFAQASYPSTTTTSAHTMLFGWTVTYMNAANDQQTFQASVMCVAHAMPTAHIVSGAIDDTSGQGTALCPKGMQATGGGYSFNDAAITASMSAPVNPQEGAMPTGWMVQTHGAQLGDQQSVYALCVSGLGHIILGRFTGISITVGTAASVQAGCVAGSLLGAGYRLNEQDGVQNVYIIRNAPLPSATGWQMTLSNLDGTNQGGTLWPICQI